MQFYNELQQKLDHSTEGLLDLGKEIMLKIPEPQKSTEFLVLHQIVLDLESWKNKIHKLQILEKGERNGEERSHQT